MDATSALRPLSHGARKRNTPVQPYFGRIPQFIAAIRPNVHVTTCPKDWIQFQESCYFFYNLGSPWKTWDQSRQLCQSMKSDLVVISSLEEQVCHKMLN
uniref:C-type lectin domain-containing protein n=1 Tax=Oryzias latipes TaxID=8090 RepID=A0A3P9IFR9_ORYLA